jgi:acid stress-induced BolA-like protein IbaG/YrbA
MLDDIGQYQYVRISLLDMQVPSHVSRLPAFLEQILAGLRTATVDVNVTPDGKQYSITVTSPAFENLPQFKRRDMVQKCLGTVRTEIPSFASCQITALHLFSTSEVSNLQSQAATDQ